MTNKKEETVIEWDVTRPDEMRILIMKGVQVRIPISEKIAEKDKVIGV